MLPKYQCSGKYSITVGATSEGTCLNCIAGKYSPTLAASSAKACTLCQAGKFSSGIGNVECSDCPSGTFLPDLGKTTASDCVKCPKGTYSTASGAIDGQTCTACRAGSYASSLGSTVCAQCAPGKFSYAAAATAEGDCEAVVIAVKKVIPTMGDSDGGQFVRVEIDSFNFSGTVRQINVQFAGVDVEVKVSGFSDRFLTILTFISPSTATGEFDVSVSESPCSSPCKQISFKFLQKDKTAVQLLSFFPTQGAMQRSSMTLNVFLSNFLLSFNTVDSVAVKFGSAESKVSKISQVDQGSSSSSCITILVPITSSAGPVQVTVTIRTAAAEYKNISFDYTYLDGNVIRTVSIEPSLVPVSTVISERLIPLRPIVSVILANLPQSTYQSTQRLGGTSADYSITASCGGVEAKIKSLLDTAVCEIGEFDCNRTTIVLELPDFQTPNLHEIKIFVPGLTDISVGHVNYGRGCNYENECTDTQIIDLLGMASASSTSCDQNFCLPNVAVPEPEILSISLSQGSSLGGQTVRVRFRNLPILVASDMKVVFQTSEKSQVNAQISSISLKPGSTFRGSEGWCNFITPSVDSSIEKVVVKLSVSLGAFQRDAYFDFEFFSPINGPAVLEGIYPTSLKMTDIVQLQVILSNFPIIKRPYNLSFIKVQIGENVYPGAVKAILESSRQNTIFTVSAPNPFSSGGFSNNSLAVKFYGDDVSRAASFTLRILSTPVPTVVRQFPLKGKSNIQTQVSLSIRYFEANGTPFSVSGGATVVETIAQHDDSCAHRGCSRYDLQITVPALISGPATLTVASFVITSGELSTYFNFTYISAETAQLKMVQPTTQILGLQAGTEKIKVFLDKFPSSACKAARSCAVEASGTRAIFGDLQGTITHTSDAIDGTLELTLLAPLAVKQAQTVTVEIKSLGLSTVSFDYTYASHATVQPVEGPVAGGTKITISAVGLTSTDTVVERTKLQIRFGESTVAISDIESVNFDDTNAWSTLRVVLKTPAGNAGHTQCTICLMPVCKVAHLVSTFVFTYFLQPKILKILPSKVTLDGRTDLSTGSRLAELTVLNLPKLGAIHQLQLTIENMPCNGTICGIFGFSQSAISTTVTIRVPALTSSGVKPVRLDFQNARTASSHLLYYDPKPGIRSALWCEGCNDGRSCILGGFCNNGVAALKDSAKLLDSTDIPTCNSKYVITVLLHDVPATSVVEEVLVSFGGYEAQFCRTVHRSQSRIEIEVETPRNIPGPGKVTMIVKYGAPNSIWSASADFTFIDPRFVLTNLNRAPLAFPTFGAQPFKVFVSNLPVHGFEARDAVAVSFGSVSAQSFSIHSISAAGITLLITPPAYTISFKDKGFSTEVMRVSLRSDASLFAETHVEFYGEPTFSAAFDGKGTKILLSFDQKTGMCKVCLPCIDARFV